MTNHDQLPNRQRLWQLVGVAGLLTIAVLFVWWPGCRKYPTATSKESMALIKLLYSACNTKDLARLAKVEQDLEKATQEGKISPAEQVSFAQIIRLAKQGDWENAEKAAYRFAQDQVRR
jgi:hypothetical protein